MAQLYLAKSEAKDIWKAPTVFSSELPRNLTFYLITSIRYNFAGP